MHTKKDLMQPQLQIEWVSSGLHYLIDKETEVDYTRVSIECGRGLRLRLFPPIEYQNGSADQK